MRHIIHKKHTHLKNKETGVIDTLALLIGIIQPITTLPQIYLVYTTRDVTSVSFFMWTSYNVSSVILLLYGFKHKLRPIIWAQALWIVVQTPMMIAVLLFR